MRCGYFEAMAEMWKALLDGKKIRHHTWKENEYLYIENKTVKDEMGNIAVFDFSYPNEWGIYTEPKKKKKVAPVLRYMNNTYLVSAPLFESEEEAKEWAEDKYVRWLIDTPYALEV